MDFLSTLYKSFLSFRRPVSALLLLNIPATARATLSYVCMLNGCLHKGAVRRTNDFNLLI